VGYSVRTERWRYVEWDDGRLGRELYDQFNDPGELRNLAASPFYAPDVAQMKQLLTRLRTTARN
jgi:arylsulfatase A-like enzyme